jgi:hypothetical protein
MQSADELRRSFRDALAATIGGVGLQARFDLSHKVSWIQLQGGDDTTGYGIACGLIQDPALPDRAWPTHLSVTYYTSAGCPPGTMDSACLLDLTMTGAGARDARILTSTALTAVLDHHRAPAQTSKSGALTAAEAPSVAADRLPGTGRRRPGVPSLEFPAGPATSRRSDTGDAPSARARQLPRGLARHQGWRRPGRGV